MANVLGELSETPMAGQRGKVAPNGGERRPALEPE